MMNEQERQIRRLYAIAVGSNRLYDRGPEIFDANPPRQCSPGSGNDKIGGTGTGDCTDSGAGNISGSWEDPDFQAERERRLLWGPYEERQRRRNEP